MIVQSLFAVTEVREVADGIFTLTFRSPAIAATVRAGQFLNIGVEHGALLRRPFSVYRVEGDLVRIIFNVVGKGTAVLRNKRPGDHVDVLGPLGVRFSLDDPAFDTGVLIGGGLGVAPLPIALAQLKDSGKEALVFIGARSSRLVVDAFLEGAHVSTDDGTRGFHGTVVDAAKGFLARFPPSRPHLFACGPTAMLRGVAAFARELGIPCEVSLEGPMACGVGICQGCPVEMSSGERKYGLMCKDGPVFDIARIKL